MTSYNYTDFILTHSMYYPNYFRQKILEEFPEASASGKNTFFL